MNKDLPGQPESEETWKSKNQKLTRDELIRAQSEIANAAERAMDAEKRAMDSEERAVIAEQKHKESDNLVQTLRSEINALKVGKGGVADVSGSVEGLATEQSTAVQSPALESDVRTLSSRKSSFRKDDVDMTDSQVPRGESFSMQGNSPRLPSHHTSVLSHFPPPSTISNVTPPSIGSSSKASLSHSVILEFEDDCPIEDLIYETAQLTNRGRDKADQWLEKLKSQDVMTVGDLRDLHDEDWASLNLTVFAARAIKNALQGKSMRTISPKTSHRMAHSTSGGRITTTGGSSGSAESET